MHMEMNAAVYVRMFWAKRNVTTEMPASAVLIMIRWIWLVLSASEPASREPNPYMREPVVPISPMIVLEVAKSGMMNGVIRTGAMKKNEWFSECAMLIKVSRWFLVVVVTVLPL